MLGVAALGWGLKVLAWVSPPLTATDLCAGARRGDGKASEQGFRAEGEVQESPGAGDVPGKFEVVGGQANRVHHHC